MFPNQQSSTHLTRIYFTILLLNSVVFCYEPICSRQDQSYLLEFSKNISTTSFPPLNWSSAISCCRWEGVSCDSNGRVNRLKLSSRGLKGEITSSLGNLAKLTHLNLSSNHLFGNFFLSLMSKSEFSSKIHTIDISNNQFSGKIEYTWLLRTNTLTNFNCSNNSFIGPFPSFICLNSPLLETLDLSHNHLSSEIPTEVGVCLHLKVFRVGFNLLFGSIPESIYNLKELVELSIPSNALQGVLENKIVGLTNLRVIEFSSNMFFGLIPQEIGNLKYLEKLYLDDNNFSGSIPLSLMKGMSLTDIDLRDNKLEGDISNLNMSRLVRLKKFDIRNNSFNGTIPESMYSCKSLVAIRVSRNNLIGQISPKIIQLKYLSFLSLSYNSFTNIKRTLQILASCNNLTLLFFGGNFLGEPLPSDKNFLGPTTFSSLKYFYLDDSELTGSFPEWLSNIKTLRIISLNRNKITGKLPHSLSTLPYLFSLSLEGNLLHGEIPRELCQLPGMTLEHKLDNFYFELPIFLRGITGVYNQYKVIRSTLVLADNKLSGNIPWDIGKLRRLQQLDLGRNFFSGHIPSSIANLENLEVLQLSENKLTGEIPISLQNLHFLSNLNVSYNDLEGRIPVGGQLATFDQSSFEGNPRLCGEFLHRTCLIEESKEQSSKEKSDEMKPFFSGLYVGFALGFSSVIVMMTLYVWSNIFKNVTIL